MNKLFANYRHKIKPWMIVATLVVIAALLVYVPILGVASLIAFLPIIGCLGCCGVMMFMMRKK